MSSTIENLTQKILDDGTEKAGAILAEAEAQAQKLVKDETEKARRQAERMLEEARGKAALAADQIVQGKRLAVRDANLEARQQVLDRVFADAEKRLDDMGDEEFFEFLCDSLSDLSMEGERLILPASRNISIDRLNQRRREEGKPPITSGGTSSRIQGGFVLQSGGVEQNNTFETLIRYYRQELEGEILNILY